MFIHLGEDVVIRSVEVIAIFNYELFQDDEFNKAFIKQMIDDMKLLNVGGEVTKSVVITESCIYYSPFSPTTLKRRSQQSIQY
ncbi:MAG: extracellular matrix regulator RemB [Tuberibacillus sp.]